MTIRLATVWTFTIYPDSGYESSVFSSYNKDGEIYYTTLTASRRGFEIHDFGSCILELYGDVGCSNSENIYDANDEDDCIQPVLKDSRQGYLLEPRG